MEAPPLPPPLSERLVRACSSIKEHSLNLAHKKTPNDIWAALEAACPSEGDGSIVPSAGGSSGSRGGGGGGGSVADASSASSADKEKKKKPSSSPLTSNRRVRIGPGAHNPLAAGNAVKTAKYNPVTFLPLFLFSMFSRAAYLYFLSQAALAWWSTVSPFAPFGPTLALSFVLAVAALKAAAEDRTRAAEDRRTNGSPARVVLPDGSLLETRWRHVKVGDVLEVRDGEAFPADLLCLKVDSPDGVAYIRTTNLDGESNLKVRRPADLRAAAPRTRAAAASLRGILTCEPPNRDLHRFAGRLVVAAPGGGEEGNAAAAAATGGGGGASSKDEEAPPPSPPSASASSPHPAVPVVVAPVTMDELLLRGCTLRNSGAAVGVVVYAGRESRVQMNAARPPRKLGSFDRFLNVQISLLLVAQVVLCASLATCSYFWREKLGIVRTHLALNDEAQGNYRPAAAYIGVLFVSFWILLSYMVPISLFVTMEIVKFALCSVFIGRDGALAAEANGGGEPARARNSDIVEDLGQVRHVFSDKTGTLTSNEMQLRAVAVKGEAYGDIGGEGEEEEEGAAAAAVAAAAASAANDASDADASVVPPPPQRPRRLKLESFAAGGDAEAALEAFDPRLARATAAMRSAGFWREAADAGGSDADVLALATSSPRAVAAAVAAAASSAASSPALARLAASASPSSGLVSGGGRTSGGGGGGGGWRGSWMGGGGGNNNNTASAATAAAASSAAAEAAASPESVSGGRSSPALLDDDDDDDPDNGPSPPAAVPTLNPAPVSARRRRLRAQGGRRGVSEGGAALSSSSSSSSSYDSDDGGVPALSTATTPGAALPRPSFTGGVASPSTMRTPGNGGGNGRESATGSARRPPLPPGAAAAAAAASAAAAAAAATPSQQQQRQTPGDELSAAVLGHHMLDFWSNVCLCHSLIVERHGSGGGSGSAASVGEEATAAMATATGTSGDKSSSSAKATPPPSLLPPPPSPINTSPLYPAYQGPSPDEVALADAARRLGFEFVGRSRTHITLRVQGHDVVHQLLNSLEFTSERARMSVITRSPDGTIRLHAKGSDAALLPRLRESTDRALLAATQDNLRAFSSRGLRTLLLASRVLGEEEWRAWNARHAAAAATLAGREKALARVAEEVERDLELVGVTAIEDKLADGVPAAVASLVRGGVKVWMITGDKQETAVNIGVACRLLRDPGRLLRCNAQEGGEEGADARLAELLEATEPWADGSKDGGGKKKKKFFSLSSSSSTSSPAAAVAAAAAAAVANNSNSSNNNNAAVPAPYPSDVTMRPAPISTATTPGESGAAAAGAGAGGRASGTGGGVGSDARTTMTLTTVAAAAAAGQLPPIPTAPNSSSSPPPLPPAIPPALYSSSRPPELVIDGRTLSHVLGRPAAEAALAELAVRCSSVVVCRASPSQKAGIVRMMKARRERARLLAAGGARLLGGNSLALPSMALRDRLLRAIKHPILTIRAATSSASNNECLLAIGDGANDVAMLQAADIGVGLLGKEGRQAANNADFAFARFASLPRLLLVHGTLADYRLSRLIKYSFYKNVAFAAMLLCFQFFNGFSGQALLDGVTSAFYNAFFTALPAGFFAGLDRPTRHLATLEMAPRAYNSRPALTAAAFWRTSVLSGVVHGAVVFFVPFLSMRTRGPRPSSDDIWSLGKTMFLAMIGVVSLELALVARFWTWPFAAALLGSYFATWPWLALLPALYRAAGKWDHAQLGVGPNLLRSPLFWLQLALVYAFAFSSRLAEHGGTWAFRPRDDMILAEREEVAEREEKRRRRRRIAREEGGSGSGGLRRRRRPPPPEQQQPAAATATDVEVVDEGGGKTEAPAFGGTLPFPASSSSPSAAPAV